MTEEKPTYEDARIIIDLVRTHFQNQNPQLGYLFFRIDSIRKNGADKVWIVICSFLESFGSKNRLYYKLKVNLNDGNFGDAHIIPEAQALKEISQE